jgi:hypothetical protein
MKKTIKKPLTIATATPVPTQAKAPVAAGKPVAKIEPRTRIITAAASIVIEAKVDVGFGNHLFVRGQGAGLSWERGVQLENVDSSTWRLTVSAKEKLQFKFLLNDSQWAQGEDVVAVPGKKTEVTPLF